MKSGCAILAMAGALCLGAGWAGERTVLPLDEGWSGEVKPEKGRVRALKGIRLPHNWDDYYGMRGLRHGNLHGTAVYRRTFEAKDLAGRRAFLVFDGAGTYLTVRLNGRELCTRKPAGRLVSTLEATGVAKEGVNDLEVVCDHPSEIQDMPWHCGGCSGIGSEGPEPFGLFRHVRFETTDAVRIAPFGVHVWHDGVCSNGFVEVEIDGRRSEVGGRGQRRTLNVACPELGVDRTVDVTVPAGGAVTNRLTFPLARVVRWSPTCPKLYYFDVSVGDDRERVRTGFATYRWPVPPYAKDKDGNDEKRFLLNGEPVFLHGTCETDNRFGANVNFDEEEIDARAAEMKLMGLNAWRDGHEPHDLRFNRHWDEDGVVWWPQISTHTYFDTPAFKRNMLAAIEQWMKERRNSPSIALWGLQNESVIIDDFAKECTELIHRLDPLAGPHGRAVTTCNYGTGTDWNVIQNWSGCYSGELRDYQYELGKDEQLLNGEYGAWRDAGFHSDPDKPYVKDEPWTEEHAAHVLWQKALRGWDVRDHVCGQFIWTYFGHESPGRPNTNVDDGYRLIDKVGPLNPKGLYTLWGRRAAAWYMYRAYGEWFRAGRLDEIRYRPLSWYIAEGKRLAAPPVQPLFAGHGGAPGQTYLHRLNCGGDEIVDSFGNRWAADSTAYTHSWSQDEDLQIPGYEMNPVLGSQDEVWEGVANAAPAEAPLFGTFRFGRDRLRFTFDVPAGLVCTVELYFVDPGSYGRIFDVALNGKVVESRFNLGVLPERTVVKREYRVTADAKGKVVLSFPRVWCNQAVVSAIAIRTDRPTPAAVRPSPSAGYPASAGLTWKALSAQVRETTKEADLPPSPPIKLAPLTPLQSKRVDPTHRADMKHAAYLFRVASNYAVTMLVKGTGDRAGKKVVWSLEHPTETGWKVEASGVAEVPERDDRFVIPMGATVNAGYYVFYYKCEGLEVSAREMK